MNLIVAVDSEWGIGCRDRLLISIRADLRNFARLTKGKTVIYGSRTLETFPNKEPLKGRRNIILSRKPDYKVENAEIARTVDEALALVSDEAPSNVFVIGGGSIYGQFLPYCDCCYITKIDKSFEKDTYFKNIDEDDAFRLVYRSSLRLSDAETDDIGGVGYFFTKYRRISHETDKKGE
ncbi:MAG: dihydrofolate reductase [Clostridia bacterium]|nr:dihydrofolate reductase [Clostridia bacterium]